MEQNPTELLKAPTRVERGISGVDRPTPMLGARGPSLTQLTWKYTCLGHERTAPERKKPGRGEDDVRTRVLLAPTYTMVAS